MCRAGAAAVRGAARVAARGRGLEAAGRRVLYGSSANRLRGGLRAPVVLRVTRGGQRVAARWGVAARCTDGARERFTNLTPPARVGAAAGFRRRERFSLEYTNVFVRYRVAFRGRFVGAGARGSLRLRSVVFNRRGGRLIARCDTGRRAWSAWTGGEPAG
jgi:hypothetical protein